MNSSSPPAASRDPSADQHGRHRLDLRLVILVRLVHEIERFRRIPLAQHARIHRCRRGAEERQTEPTRRFEGGVDDDFLRDGETHRFALAVGEGEPERERRVHRGDRGQLRVRQALRAGVLAVRTPQLRERLRRVRSVEAAHAFVVVVDYAVGQAARLSCPQISSRTAAACPEEFTRPAPPGLHAIDSLRMWLVARHRHRGDDAV